MVFDKGVESIHFVYYHYLTELTQSLCYFLNKSSNESKLKSQFDQKYKFICDRLRKELDLTFGCLIVEKMSFNDVKYTKIATHMMFVQSLSSYANDTNKLESETVLEMIKKHDRQINCFIKLFLNK